MEEFSFSKYFEERGDTYPGMLWNDFLKLLEKKGFKSDYSRKFEAFNYEGKIIIEEEIIYVHEGKGLIVYAESYNKELLCFAKMFAEVHSSGENFGDEQLDALVLVTCDHWGNGNGTMSLNFQSSEGLFFYLAVLESAFTFCPIWHSKQPLRLLNRREVEEVPQLQWGRVSEQKLRKSEMANRILRMIV